MVFLGIYRAIYDYTPQGENELAIQEGDLLFVLEKSTEDDWWKAKKKAQNEDEEEPEGLIPNNYVEEATPIQKARALYDYTRQTDEELSFSEDAALDVYDTSDPDWTLVGLDGEYGFAPSNYIEVSESAPPTPARPKAVEPEPESRQSPIPASPDTPTQSPAAAIAGILQQKTGPSSPTSRARSSPPASISIPARRPQEPLDEPEDERPVPAPSLPQRPQSEQRSPYSPISPQSPTTLPSPPNNHRFEPSAEVGAPPRSPGGFHLYNIHEMVSHAGKNRKMPMVLGINIAKGVIMIAPEKSRDGPSREWTAEKLTHYSIEGKHVFMELVRPSKSVDFHAGAKDTAEEIVAALGELAGAARAEGLREVIAAGTGSSGQKKGHMLYDFMAQGDDEVTVAVDDEVIVLDDTKSDEWWMVRRLKNGKEGVVPSSYVEVTGVVSPAPSSSSGLNAGRSIVEQNRLEEERLTRQASKGQRRREGSDSKGAEVGQGLPLPQRNSSLMHGDNDSKRSSQRSKRESRDGKAPSTAKPKPDPSKTRTWTDRSGSFKVEAEFIGLRDGKIHLHKLNGVKIAVPVPKMAIEDLEYVERVTGVSLDEDKPLSDIKRRSTQKDRTKVGASISNPKKPEYDWFDFFLQCGVNPQICERYASSFARDEMSEESLPDIEPQLLRTLGLKEGDILRVMKYLDNKFNRTAAAREKRNVSFGGASVLGDEGSETADGAAGGLFSGPGGTLRNNTRKGRPAPAVQTNNIVDPKVFEQKVNDTGKKATASEATSTPSSSAPSASKGEEASSGFDDNAWEPKPSKQAPAPAAASTAPAPAPNQAVTTQQPTLAGSLAELSLLSPPLQPTPAAPPSQPISQPQVSQAPSQIQSQQQPVATGANPALFDAVARSTTALQPQPTQPLVQQPTGFLQSQPPAQVPIQPQLQQFAPPRQRPLPPQQIPNQTTLLAPPPPRSLSAPQNPGQQSAFGPPPLQPQLTGYQNVGHVQAQVMLPGQSLHELSQQRAQVSPLGTQPLQMQPTGFISPGGTLPQFQNGIAPQSTGFGPLPQQPAPMQPLGFGQFQQQQPTGFQSSLQQQLMNGQQTGSPFADPPRQPFQPMVSQPTGIQPSFSPQGQLHPQQTGINAFLPPALQPQVTGANGFGNPGFGQAPPPPAPPIPAIPQQPTIAPLQPQKTGPAPPVRFGVSAGANKLAPQPTGRRANLSQATPQNPFGF